MIRSAPERDRSIDALRGAVMVLMVLDHVRDFCTSSPFAATDPDHTSALLFFTRWVTHFCAPVFMLLAGAGAGIARGRGRSPGDLARFLLSRGLWLIVLELSWLRLGWRFEIGSGFLAVQVIWALGWSMIALAGLLWLPTWAIAVVGAILVLGHNALDGVSPEDLGAFGGLWRVLHAGGRVTIYGGQGIYIVYPLVPWIGVMALGYVLALVQPTRRHIVMSGATAVMAFLVLRISNVYGDPHPFVAREGLRTVFAFLNCEKYPPSLCYLLMTLGPALIVLGALRGRSLNGPIGSSLVVFGRVPLFFYLLHVPLVHALSLPFRAWRGLPLVAGPFHHGLDLSLGWVYALTALAIGLLVWPARRWEALKRARPGGWLSYL